MSEVKLILFGFLFLLNYGLIYYIYIKSKNSFIFEKWLKTFVLYQVFFCLVGVFDYILFEFGIISLIRDYNISNQVDSFYDNPNPFGIISAISFLMLFYIPKLLLKNRVSSLIILLTGVVISNSSMALGIVILGILIRYFSLKTIAIVFFSFSIIILIYIQNIDIEFLYVIFNKRIEIWTVAIEYFFKNNYLIGIGTGSFQNNIDSIDNSFGINSNYGLHSMYMWLLVETGVFGLVIYTLFIYVIFVLNSMNNQIIIILKKILLVVLLSQITEFLLDHTEIFQLLYSLVLGIIFGRYYSQKKEFCNAKSIAS